jgi:hypothetical protein
MDSQAVNYPPRQLSAAQDEVARRVQCDCADLIRVGVYLLLQMQIVCCATNFATDIALHNESKHYLQQPTVIW